MSSLNPIYFDLEDPWYFNMTIPYEYSEEVVDISQAPEEAEFPEVLTPSATSMSSPAAIASGALTIAATTQPGKP